MSHSVIANTKNTWRLSVRSVAEQQKIDPQTLAECAGLPLAHIQRMWEQEDADVWLSELDRVAQALHVPLSMLFKAPSPAGDLSQS